MVISAVQESTTAGGCQWRAAPLETEGGTQGEAGMAVCRSEEASPAERTAKANARGRSRPGALQEKLGELGREELGALEVTGPCRALGELRVPLRVKPRLPEGLGPGTGLVCA